MPFKSVIVKYVVSREERAGCLTLIVLLVSWWCKCPVALPHGNVGLSAVCECGISLSYLYTVRKDKINLHGQKIHTVKPALSGL